MAGSTRSPMTAADIMTRYPRTCSAFSSVLEASTLFQDADCGAVPVVNGGRPIGILTDRDVALAVANNPDLGNRPVSEFMSKDVIPVAPALPSRRSRRSSASMVSIACWWSMPPASSRASSPGPTWPRTSPRRASAAWSVRLTNGVEGGRRCSRR